MAVRYSFNTLLEMLGSQLCRRRVGGAVFFQYSIRDARARYIKRRRRVRRHLSILY